MLICVQSNGQGHVCSASGQQTEMMVKNFDRGRSCNVKASVGVTTPCYTH